MWPFSKKRPAVAKGDEAYHRFITSTFGFRPNDIEVYKLALIHRSASQLLVGGGTINNERLEFLGDAIIEGVVSDYLYSEFPQENEGFLTQMRSRLVNRATLNELCMDIGLSAFIKSNAGGNGVQRNINGDAFEALVGAIYLDKGYDVAKSVLVKLIADNISLDEVTSTETDFKSRLIEWCQKRKHHIRFSTAFGDGGSSKNPVFRSVAIIDGLEIGYGFGTSKKEAEQRAAYSVLPVMDDEKGDMLLDAVDKLDSSSGSVPTPAPAAPKKRRRRKPKPAAQAQVAAESVPAVPAAPAAPAAPAPEVEAEAKPVVRRGRKPKAVVSDGAQSAPVNEDPVPVSVPVEEAVVKRKPGRPKKVVAEGGVKVAAKPKSATKRKPVAKSGAKRGPGRPKKTEEVKPAE